MTNQTTAPQERFSARSKPFCAAAYVLLYALGLSSCVLAQQARTITFNAPGANTAPGSFEGTYPSGINASGAVTGEYQDKKSVYHGFLRSRDGKYITFDAPGAGTTANSGTNPYSINDRGEITGAYIDATGVCHGFLRSPEGKFISFDVPGAGGYGSFPINLNQEGSIVGFYTDANFLFHSFVRYPDGQFSAFLAPGQCATNGSQGCFGSEVTAINPSGLSVGNFMDNTADLVEHGLIRHPDGGFTTFNAPGAGTGSGQGTGCPGCFAGLDDYGDIAGIYADSNTVYHGFIRYKDGQFASFDAPGAGSAKGQGTGCPGDCSVLLNNRGEIVGTYIDASGVLHGYLREPNGEIQEIGPHGSLFTSPAGINYSGTIAGYYVDASDVYHGFLRIP